MVRCKLFTRVSRSGGDAPLPAARAASGRGGVAGRQQHHDLVSDRDAEKPEAEPATKAAEPLVVLAALIATGQPRGQPELVAGRRAIDTLPLAAIEQRRAQRLL
jgi:hypothetical protein